MKEKQADAVTAVKLTLSSGKVVILKEYKIRHGEEAGMLAGSIAKNNAIHAGMLIQKELVKMLVIQINGKNLALQDKEDLDKLFKPNEYKQVAKYVTDIMGDDDLGEPKMEIVTLSPSISS